MTKICLNCGKELINNQTKYCSHECQIEYQNNQKISAWKKGEFDGLKGTSQISDVIKRYMLQKTNYSCEICGWGKINPFTNTVPLEIHHKDGNYKNNTENNLQVLCPNCHSLTENYRGANRGAGREDRLEMVPRKEKNHCIDCGIEISDYATRCMKCAGLAKRQDLPISREDLKYKIRTQSFLSIGKEFGISDNGIRKWCIHYNLPTKKMEIKNYSDQEWEQI